MHEAQRISASRITFMGIATKNIGVAHLKQNFQLYYAVAASHPVVPRIAPPPLPPLQGRAWMDGRMDGYYAVVKYRLLERYGKRRERENNFLVNFLLLKLTS